MTNPEVDIVVLNHNGKKFLDRCLRSLFRCSYPAKSVYVLDNASTDDDVEYIRALYPEVDIIENPLNNGYCAAYNVAFHRCKGKYIICLNNDVEVKPDWLEPLVSLAESDDSIAALQPKILSFFDESKFEYAGASGGMMDVFGYPFLRGRVFSTIEEDAGQYNDVSEVFWTSGAAMFLRRSALAKSGMLDETIVHHMDEIDLCWRLRMAGFRMCVQPASVILHIGGATIQPHSFKKVYWNHRNSLYIMMKNYSLQNVLTKVPVHVLLDYVAVAQALVTLNFTTVKGILAAHVWLIINLPLVISKRRAVQKTRLRDDTSVIPFLYGGSIVWDYFARGKKTCRAITQSPIHEYKTDPRNFEWAESSAAASQGR